MVLSMGLVLAIIGVIMLLTWRPNPDPVREVDIGQALAAAQADASFEPLVPALQDLRATSARWQVTEASEGVRVWHVGYVTPDEEYLQVSQAEIAGPNYISEQTLDGVAVETVTVDGTDWQIYEAPNRISVVSTADGVTTIVGGSGSVDSVLTAAGSLIPGGLTTGE